MTKPTPTHDIEIFADHAPEILTDLANRVTSLARSGLEIDDEDARQLGIEVAIKIAQDWGGASIYVPSNLQVNIANRDMALYKEFNGHNQNALARKYKISSVWVYKIIKRVRQQLQEKQQNRLFD